MKIVQKVTASSQVDATLPLWIRSPDVVIQGNTPNSYSQENHRNFVSFLTTSGESQERLGFGQDLLQNLLKYSDFDFYQNPIISYGFLTVDGSKGFIKENDVNIFTGGENPLLSARPQDQAAKFIAGQLVDKDLLMLDKDEVDELELVDGYGFPDENGVLLIDDEVILYRRKEGNKFYDLRRGSSAVTVLPTYRQEGKYLSKTEPASHFQGSVVYNLSVLSLMAILDAIHNTYTHNITRDRVVPEVNRATILKHIKDFFRSKGSKLGIKALFKILFAENDVDVFYPGDRMITPSKSSYAEGLIVRTVPVPVTFCNREENYALPDKTIGSFLTFKSYSATITNEFGEEQTFMPEDEFARSVVDYASSYQVEDETQYEMFVSESALQGKIITNPRSRLTRDITGGQPNDNPDSDYTTITVESTLGFPNKGVIFIDNEAIFYEEKTPNQFLKCKRGYIGVEANHRIETYVYGPYYIETRIIDQNDVEYVSRSWPVGLVEDVDIKDPGLLHTIEDNVYALEPGRIDLSDPLLCRLNYKRSETAIAKDVTYTFLENYSDELVQQSTYDPNQIGYVADRTHGPDGIFYDDDYAFISTSGFPSYPIGPFGSSVGRLLKPEHYMGIVPRRNNIMPNPYISKGSDLIGTFVDGVRAYSQMSPEKIVQGRIARIDVGDSGEGYINPTVVITPGSSEAEAIVAENTGQIKSIEVTSDDDFSQNPRVRISSGEGAVIIPSHDRYGRITSVRIQDGGRYYNDVPTIRATDLSGKGKGALFSCEVTDGKITNIKILNHGIDYDKSSTEIVVIPVGSGATASAVVEYYDINRYMEIFTDPSMELDQGNGFVYQPPLGIDRNYYGYVCSPTKLREELNDDGSKHSPILGFAYDGNPIYGPYGYVNGEDEEEGIERQLSAYVLRQSRNSIIPGGGDMVASNPPSTDEYPMGYFIQDFNYAPDIIAGGPTDKPTNFALGTHNSEFTHTELSQYIRVERGIGDDDSVDIIIPERVLDRNNGKVCNTPDYPKELYPDGVYCYFVTIDDSGNPQYPYILGENFNNRPISQVVNVISQVSISPLPRQTVYSSQIVDGTNLTFDFTRVERLRNPYLESTNKEIELKIGEVSEGSIDEVHVQIPLPARSAVGDYLYFDNSGTSGAGAQAVISYIRGVEITSTEGSEIGSVINSHQMVISSFSSPVPDFSYLVDDPDLKNIVTDLGENLVLNTNKYTPEDVTEDYTKSPPITLVESSRYSIGDSYNTVIRFNESDQTIGRALIETVSRDIPQVGDVGYDAKYTPFLIGDINILPESGNQQYLWIEDVSEFKVGDNLRISTGYRYRASDTGEVVTIQQIYSQGRVRVRRAENSRPIPDQTSVSLMYRYLYTIECVQKHMLKVGDRVTFSGSIYDEVNGTHTVVHVDETETQFSIYTSSLYDKDSKCLKYKTSSYNVEGLPLEVALISGGYNYGSLPRVVGTYHREMDRAQTKITMQGTGIGSIEILKTGYGDVYDKNSYLLDDPDNNNINTEIFDKLTLDLSEEIYDLVGILGGARYVNPEVYIIDREGRGFGAEAVATVENGIVTEIIVTNPGEGYIDPVIILIETNGKFICTTNDIGKIKSFRVLNPGRDISADRSLKPEIMIDTKCVLMYDKNVVMISAGGSDILEATEQDIGRSALQLVSDRVTSPLDTVLEINEGNIIFKDPDNCGYSIIINGGDYAEEEAENIIDGTDSIGDFDNFGLANFFVEEYRFPIFLKGDIVYQGLPTNITALGTVIDYDSDRQIVTLEKVYGHLEEDEYLNDILNVDACTSYLLDDPDRENVTTDSDDRLLITGPFNNPDPCHANLLDEPYKKNIETEDGFNISIDDPTCVEVTPPCELNGKKANVILEGQADCRIVVNGSAKAEGKFIDDTSKLSEWYAVIQDSYRYQWFSYVIASPIQQVDYETFVKEIIHPAGFIQFADLTIHSSVDSKSFTGERDLITIYIDPCSPLKLLAGDGTPILTSQDKLILVKDKYCEIPPLASDVPVLELTVPGKDDTPLEIADSHITTYTGILLRLNI